MGETSRVDTTDLSTTTGTGGQGVDITSAPVQPLAIPAGAAAEVGAFTPLRLPLFRDRWIASTVSGVGTWMQDTAGTWLMTVLTTSPLLIALMQTAASLPVLFCGVLAGATADIFDRRRLLIFWQCWMLGAVAILAALTLVGWVSPVTLLLFTFLLNIGSAMNNPAWQAIVPELVPREQLPSAVTLNAASNNLARAVGPALGGLLVAAFAKADAGAGWTFALNSVSFAAVIWVLIRWQRQPLFKSALPTERLAGSIRTGLRYLRYAPTLQNSLWRAFGFTFFVSAVWSLLALVAKQDMHQGAMGYGILNGSMGLGAVAAASTLARVRKRLGTNVLLSATSLYFVAALLLMGLVHTPWVIIPVLLGAGYAWTSTMSTINVSVQLSAPAWVSARALGLYLMTFQGGLALGSVAWGAVAQRSSASVALIAAAVGMAISLPFLLRIPILQGSLPDLSPHHWTRPVPELAAAPHPEDGPVRISVEYRIKPENLAAFSRAIHEQQAVRQRDGAVRWGIFRDAADPERINETFIMENWLDYLRSRERTTAADMEVRERVRALHSGDDPPRVSHQVWLPELPVAAPVSIGMEEKSA